MAKDLIHKVRAHEVSVTKGENRGDWIKFHDLSQRQGANRNWVSDVYVGQRVAQGAVARAAATAKSRAASSWQEVGPFSLSGLERKHKAWSQQEEVAPVRVSLSEKLQRQQAKMCAHERVPHQTESKFTMFLEQIMVAAGHVEGALRQRNQSDGRVVWERGAADVATSCVQLKRAIRRPSDGDCQRHALRPSVM